LKIFGEILEDFLKTVSFSKHFLQNFLKNPYKVLRGPRKIFQNLLSLSEKILSFSLSLFKKSSVPENLEVPLSAYQDLLPSNRSLESALAEYLQSPNPSKSPTELFQSTSYKTPKLSSK
jgi:hypothetical protein